MRPLLQHASRLPKVNAATITPSPRPSGRFVTHSPPICGSCLYRHASSTIRRSEGSNGSRKWLQRQFSGSSTWLDEKKPPGPLGPIAMPPPATAQKPKPASSVDQTPEELIARQERLRREWEEQQRKREEEALRKKQQEEEARRKREEEEEARRKRVEEETLRQRREAEAQRKKQEQQQKHKQEALEKAQQPTPPKPAPYQPKPPTPEPVSEQPLLVEAQRRAQEPTVSQDKEDIVDNVKRVPDEQLPSHQERQRSNFEKRFAALMDELLPKIAVVTQKVNTYTGTDYSGVEALRREIQEQGMHGALITNCPSNTQQRSSLKLAVLRSTRRKKPSMLLSNSRLLHRKKSLPSSNASTPGPLVISNATCL